MTEGKLFSLMLYAVALSTDLGGVGYQEVKMLADAISSSPPGNSDARRALQWLEKNGYISTKWWKHKVTDEGAAIYKDAIHETKEAGAVWKKLESVMNDRILLHSTP